MKTSQSGIALLKRFEGLELEAYQDIAGVWTIGYGHTGKYPPGFRLSGKVKAGDRLTEAEAEDLLKIDLRPRENAVVELVRVPFNQNEFDALVSFVYNVGVGAFRGSTVLRRLNRGARMSAADALTWWNKATVGGVLREILGLTRRRAAEKALFISPLPKTVEHHRSSNACPVEGRPSLLSSAVSICGKR